MYIFWWAISAALLFFSLDFSSGTFRVHWIMLVWSAVLFYVGYRAFKKHQEDEQDRKAMRDYLAVKTAEAEQNLEDRQK